MTPIFHPTNVSELSPQALAVFDPGRGPTYQELQVATLATAAQLRQRGTPVTDGMTFDLLVHLHIANFLFSTNYSKVCIKVTYYCVKIKLCYSNKLEFLQFIDS